MSRRVPDTVGTVPYPGSSIPAVTTYLFLGGGDFFGGTGGTVIHWIMLFT